MAKTLIGVVGLAPLPHRFNNTMSMEQLTESALNEARILYRGGADSIIVQNLHDLPPGPDEQIETAAYMSAITAEIRREVGDMELGVNVLSGDPRANIAIAAATGCSYVRLKTYVGGVIATDGYENGCCSLAISYRHKINADHVKIYADVFDRMSSKVGTKDIGFMASQAVGYGKADGVIVSGANIDESIALAEAVRGKIGSKKLLLGGGANLDTMTKWAPVFDAAVVGLAFRKSGYSSEYDEEVIKRFCGEFDKYR